MRTLFAAIALDALILLSSCHGHPASRRQQWQEDFTALETQFLRNQIDPLGRVTRGQWDNGIAQLHALPIEALSDAVIAANVEHLLALYHDGHIKMLPDKTTSQPDYLPVRFRWFPSGIYVTSAVDERLQGAQLLHLGTADAAAILPRIAPWVSVENESGLHAVVSSALWNTAVLLGAQIIEPGQPVPMRVRVASGQEMTVIMKPQPLATIHFPVGAQLPQYRQNRTPTNWMILMPDATVYVRYEECHDIARSRALAEQLSEALRHDPLRIIVDLRGNEGGDSAAFSPILDVLRTRNAKTTRLITLTDRETFSSAFRNAIEMKNIGAAVVGEAPSQRPVYTGNVRSFLLPHSRLQIRYTTKWSRLGPADALELKPDIAVQPTPAQYLDGKDPVLDRALQVRQ